MKKMISVLLTAILFFCWLTVMPTPASAYISGDYEYEILDDGTAEITGFNSIYSFNVNIPESLNGFKVTSIGDYAFHSQSQLINVTVPDTVTKIGKAAFWGCSGLWNINLSNSLKTIGDSAFLGCSALLGITFPDSLTSIGKNAFYECAGIISIDIPNSVKSIGEGAFEGCSRVVTVTIPDSVESIGNYAFGRCSSLSNIIVSEGNPVFNSHNNCNAIIEAKTNALLFGCKDTVIPDSVTGIGIAAFYGCSNLTHINIPNSVTSIDKNAFRDCKWLTSVTIPKSVTDIGESAFGFDFDDDTWTIVKVNGFTISGYLDTAAEKYAQDNGFTFIPLEDDPTEPPIEPKVIILGDADNDNKVTILDATVIQRTIAELPTKTYNASAADVDKDGSVTIMDATAIQRYLAELDTNAKGIGEPTA